MIKKIITSVLLIIFLSQNIITFADSEWSNKETWVKTYNELLWKKVWFLVEWTDSWWNIKRDENWYLIDNFLANDTVKNINSWFNWDYGNVRLETSSANNIASYFPTVFNWNIPEKIYELKDWNIVEWSGKDIYTSSEKNNLCTYGFTRSIDSSNDITTKIDIYWLSNDWSKLIGKDIYNSKIIKQIEKTIWTDSNKIQNFLDSVWNKAILINDGINHQMYNYSNYGWSIKKSIIWANMNKYNISAYFEKLNEIIQSDISFINNWTLDWTYIELAPNKKEKYISLISNDEEEHKYFLINDNKLVWENWITNFNPNELFITYWDFINRINNNDLELIRNIKVNYYDNVVEWIVEKFKDDKDWLYEKGRIKNTLFLIANYLKNQWISMPSKFSKKLFNSNNYNELGDKELWELVWAYYLKFLETLEISFDVLKTDSYWNSSIVDYEWNFSNSFPIWTLEDIITNIWFSLYTTKWLWNKLDFSKTLVYWDLWGSFWIFPKIKTDSWDLISLHMSFSLKGEPNIQVKKLYNTIIWWSDLAIEYINNEEYKYIYWFTELLKLSSRKSWKLTFRTLYSSAWILDFFFKNDLNDILNVEDRTLKMLLVLSLNYFNNWEEYQIRDISKDKVTTKHPYVFPVSYYISKEDREYSYYSTWLKKLKHWETSYFDVCLWNNNIKNLLKATPESKVYTKKITKNWKEFLVTYKVLEIQYKFAWELTMWTDFGLYWEFPPEQSINLWNFMNTDPLKNILYKWENVKIENFLSWKNINIWSWFANRNTDKYSYWFRVFWKAWDNIISYKENGASNRLYDPKSWHLFNPIVNSLKNIEWNNFWNWDWEILIETWNDDTTLWAFNYTNDLYSTISCPIWYDIYDDYESVYKDIFKKQIVSVWDNEKINKFPFLKELNYRKLNWIDYQPITSYFNTPRPFCIHNSLPKDKDSVIGYIKKMFVVDEWWDELKIKQKFDYVLENNTNPFIYYDDEKWAFKFSTVYLNTLRQLFSSEYQKFPTYNKVSENLDLLYTWDKSKKLLWYINYTWQAEEIIDNVILYNIRKEDKDWINFQARYTTQKAKLLNILWGLDKIYFSWIYWLNLFKNEGSTYNDFSHKDNAELFPIIWAIKTVKKSWIDFYCKDENWIKTNSLILKWECISKITKIKSINENIYINNWKDIAKWNWAFLNNTFLLPFFKPGISIKDTSWTLFLNKDKNSQEKLPFINKVIYDKNTDDLNFKPRVTALRWINTSEMIENQLNQWYWYRAWWFLFPYSKFLSSTVKKDFNNLLINSSTNLEAIQRCINIFDPTDDDKLNDDWICNIWFTKWYSEWVFSPFLINNLYSNTLWVKWNDYTTIDIPLSFADIEINKDMVWYSSSNILNKKAELIWWKSSVLIYKGDYLEKDKTVDLLTWYVTSSKNTTTGNFMFLSIDNSSTWLNNNSIFYEIWTHYIPEVCLFWDNKLNSCIEEYNIFDVNFINRWTSQESETESKVCIELDGSDRVYTLWSEDENDIDQTWYCNLSCTTVGWEERIFSSNNYALFTDVKWTPVCKETEPIKLKLFDWYSLNNFLDKNDESISLWKYYEKWTWLNGTWIPINSDDWLCFYNDDIGIKPLQCTDWYLSRYNNEITKAEWDLKENPAYRNSFTYIKNPEIWKRVSTNYNGVLNNDLIILTSNTKSYKWIEPIIEWGYIWYNWAIIDNISWWIKEPYVFSDNDNLNWEWQSFINSSLLNTNTKTGRQWRRDRIRDQLKISAWSNNDLNINPVAGLNYISYKISKDDFYSLNWVFRLAKDPRKFFSNLKIHNPEDDTQLLSDLGIYDTLYSYNNLTVKYWNKFYTWWNNDTTCNWIDPNKTYNKIDLYSWDKEVSREDTMTVCIRNGANLSEKQTISNDIYVLLPIKPTKGLNKINRNWYIESDNQSNSIINTINWTINGNETKRDTKLYTQTYFQGYFTNKNNSLDYSAGFLDNPDRISSDSGVKWRYVKIQRHSESDRCEWESNWRDYWYTGYTTYDVKFYPNKSIISRVPKVFVNGFITRQSTDKNIFVLPINISTIKATYTWSNWRKELKRGRTAWYGCWSDSDDKREARKDARDNMTPNIEFFDQKISTLWNVSISSSLTEFNKWNIINSYFIPPVQNINDYSSNISYTNVIKDSYFKAWNLLNNLGFIKWNENYVKWSLKENNYKINVWDYLDFEHRIEVTWDITPQMMFIKTQLDRWLDLDISSLEFEKNWFKQYLIYTNTDENKEIIWKKYNTQYTISDINTSTNNINNVFNSNWSNSYNKNISISKNKKITVTKGKLFLEVLSPTAKVYWTKWTKYWSGNSTDITLIFERNNWIIKEEDLSDIFTDLWTNLKAWDILTIWAWEYIRFSDSSVNLKILWFNSLPEYLLNYDRSKVMVDEQIVWIPLLDSWFNNLEINPGKTQPYYVFKCDRLNNEQKFRKSNTVINFTDNIWSEYCWVFNKYNDIVFNWYLNALSSYTRSIMPSEEYRFSYGDEVDDNGKLLWLHSAYNNEPLTRTSRWFRNWDREKQLLINLWLVKNWDIISIKYKAKVNKYNDIWHILYNYNDIDSKSVQISNEDNDTLLDSIHSKNTDIYTKALNSQLYFFTHYWDEVNIYDNNQWFEDSTSIKSKLEIVPNIDISIINLSWRKWYVWCNPTNEKVWKCDQFNSIETLNRDWEDNSSKWEVIKKDWESQSILYKWQKFFFRSTITNNYITKNSIDNTLSKLNLKLWYNSDLVLFDWVIIENSFNSDDNLQLDTLWIKTTTKEKDLDINLTNIIDSRKDVIQDIQHSSIAKSYKQIDYTINTNNYNTEGWVTVDYLFTMKNSLNAENIKELFWTAFLKDIWWIFVLTSEFEKNTNSEYIYPITNNNSAYTWWEDYEGTLNNNIDNLFNNNWISTSINNINSKWWYWFQYFKMPFSDNYKFLEDDKEVITNLNPNLAVFKSRIINFGWGISWTYSWDSSDWILALELVLSNTSNENITLVQDSLRFSLPNWFELDKIEYTSLDDSSKVSVDLITEELYWSSNNTSVEVDRDYGKKTYVLSQQNDILIPGERIQYLIYLNVNRNLVDLYSTFTSNINIIEDTSLNTLFTDTWINIDKWLWELSIKSLPIISENDAYFWAGFVKNKVTNIDLLEDNNWESWYNVIAWQGSRLDYSWSNANNKVLDWSIQPQIFNITDITDEIKNNYSVISGTDLLSNPSISYVSGGNPYYIIKANGVWEVNLTNNTLYYFWDDDVYIGEVWDEIDNIDFIADINSEKNNFPWITIFTKWEISVNHNISLYNDSSNTKISLINYVAFIWNRIEINPRVSSIEWSYVTPLTNNAYMEVIDDGTSIKYSSSGNIWVFRTWYSNIPLSIKWNVIWGNIIREREINEVIDDQNITEKYEFDFKLYLWIPPVLRK